MTEIKNAIIKSTQLGPEDHGIFTAWILVEGPGWGCGFGGYSFQSYDKALDRPVGSGFGVEFIRSVLDTVGVGRWEKLVGTAVRVESEGPGGRILRIGHLLEDRWFDPRVAAEAFRLAREVTP